MKKHQMAGVPVKIENGPLKDKYFKVIDYLVNQYQGKDIERIAASQAALVTPVVGRGHKLDDRIVFGQLYPSMEFICVHDDELIKTVQPPLKVVEGGKDDTRTTSEGDNQTPVAGQPEPDGRAVSSPKLSVKDGGKSGSKGKKN